MEQEGKEQIYIARVDEVLSRTGMSEDLTI